MGRIGGGLMALTLMLATPASAERTRVELESFLGAQPSLMMGSGIAVAAIGGGTRVGLPLGEQTVVMVGLEGHGGGSDDGHAYMVTVPLELKVYVTKPAAGRLVPQLRVGGGYSRSGMTFDGNSTTAHRIFGSGSLGVRYFFSERFAAGIDAGLTYGRNYVETDEPWFESGSQWDLGLDWRLGLLFRI